MSFWRPFENQIKEERTDEDYTEESPECIVLKLQDMVQGITSGDFGSFACISPPASATSPVHQGVFETHREEPGLASGAHCMPTVQPPSFKSNAEFATNHSTCSALISPCWIPQPDIVTSLEPPGYYAQPEVCSSPVKRKQTRPFIAMTATIPVLPSGSSPPDVRYEAFRSAMFEAMRVRNGGSLSVSNPRMRREVRGAAAAAAGGAGYQARRARNNLAAKRSRDLRKLKEDELAIRAAFLEHANAELRRQIHAAAAGVCTDCHSRI